MSTKQQISVVAARLTEFQEGFEKLSTADAQWVIINSKEAVALFVTAVANRPTTINCGPSIRLSTIISGFKVPATTEKFFVKDKFKVNTKNKYEIKISYLDENFKKWFQNKVEGPHAGSIIAGRKLKKSSLDAPILEELGGFSLSEISLGEIYAALKAQPNGESGNLLNNGLANIFYVKDIDGNFRAVTVNWSDNGWCLRALEVGFPFTWRINNWIFSR